MQGSMEVVIRKSRYLLGNVGAGSGDNLERSSVTGELELKLKLPNFLALWELCQSLIGVFISKMRTKLPHVSEQD